MCTKEEDEAVKGGVSARGAIFGAITAALLIAPSVQPFAPLHFLKGLPLPPLPPLPPKRVWERFEFGSSGVYPG